jgi:hypothetical protein
MNLIYKSGILFFIINMGLSSCKKFVDIPVSPQLITTDAIFKDNNTAIAAVNGVYTSMRAASPSFENGAISIYPCLSADELVTTSASSTYDPFFKNGIPANNNTILSTFWTTPYNTIYRTNIILEGLTKATGLTDSVKSQLTGEMEVVRAFTYLNLVNLFGDVPLITTSAYSQNAMSPRTPSDKIFQQIVVDLTAAQQSLGTGFSGSGKSRPGKLTATALLARVYLYQKDWAKAEAEASAVINSQSYHLAPDLNQVFEIGSDETIWEIASPGETKNTSEGAIFIPSSSTVLPTFAVASSLMNVFENGDMRKSFWLDSVVQNGVAYYYPYKYKNRVNSPVTEDEVVLRLAEQYLIRAEADSYLSQLSAGINDLNVIRSRAGLTPLSANLNQLQLLSAVAQERRIEFFTEWGFRWFDLKRTGVIDQVLGMEKPGWQGYEQLYPIPYQQIQTNPALTQNAGYN